MNLRLYYDGNAWCLKNSNASGVLLAKTISSTTGNETIEEICNATWDDMNNTGLTLTPNNIKEAIGITISGTDPLN